MPVIFKVYDIPAKENEVSSFAASDEVLLRSILPGDYGPDRPVGKLLRRDRWDIILLPKRIGTWSPTARGLVAIALHAYNWNQNLEIKPDDVWATILSQLGVYVRSHADDENVKKHFVSLKDTTGFKVDTEPKSSEALALELTALLNEKLVDKASSDWLLPQFTTTTPVNTVINAARLLGTSNSFFAYCPSGLTCGIPKVTLLGDRADWESILARVAKLKEFGEEPTQWVERLTPILKRFVETFDAPDIDFWGRLIQAQWGGPMIPEDEEEAQMMSGPIKVSGWITAFCFWDSGGDKSEVSYPAEPAETEIKYVLGETKGSASVGSYTTLVIDGITYPVLQQIPVTDTCDFSVKIVENGVEAGGSLVTDQLSRCFRSGPKFPDSIGVQPIWYIHTLPEKKPSKVAKGNRGPMYRPPGRYEEKP